MKKYTIYAICMVGFLLIALTVVFKYYDKINDGSREYALLARKGASSSSPEWISAQNQAAVLVEAVETNPADTKSALQLAGLFIREARITGNHMYYDMAAMKYINHVLRQDSLHVNAVFYKAIVQLSQHHFSDGLVTAEKARTLNPYNAYVYGILVDANVELGNYAAAVENSDKMVSIRPDLSSYSRIAYLREIHGDLPGAIDAMKMAVTAGAPGDESTEWSRVQLGQLYEQAGALKYAEMHYTIANDERPGYPYALAGLGRLALAANDVNKAIAYFEKADSSVNDYAIREQLASAYELTGKKREAASLRAEVIQGMTLESEKGLTDPEAGHYSDRELAYAYLAINNTERALQHAMAEYNRRPDNIDVNEALAWVYFKRNDAKTAMVYIDKALRTHCKNPTLLCHAGLIYARAGEKEKAKTLLEEAFVNNPVLDHELKSFATQILSALKQTK